jgi:hypothetical protein
VCPVEVLATSPDAVTTTTLGRPDDNEPVGCGLSLGASDTTVEFTAPADGDYTFDTFGSSFDTILYALDACGGTELACNDDAGFLRQSELTLTLTADETVILVVDGFVSASGDVVLNVQ